MITKAEKFLAIALLIVSAIVGIVGYSFSRASSPPNKIWFDAGGGDVIFDHAYHATLAECWILNTYQGDYSGTDHNIYW